MREEMKIKTPPPHPKQNAEGSEIVLGLSSSLYSTMLVICGIWIISYLVLFNRTSEFASIHEQIDNPLLELTVLNTTLHVVMYAIGAAGYCSNRQAIRRFGAAATSITTIFIFIHFIVTMRI